MRRFFTFGCIGVFFLSIIGVKGQNVCSCWQQRDTSFHYVPFDGASPPYYRNDDLSTDEIRLPFNFCYWGQPQDSIWINTNGNVSLQWPIGTWSADTFPRQYRKMIAPFWSDVYTIGGPPGSDVVLYKITAHYIIVQWDSVGYFANYDPTRTNSFQLIITDGTDPILPPGNNVEFCYKQMNWTTGTASGGNANGLRGDPATVGANEGNDTDFVQIGLFDSPNANYYGQFPPEGVNSSYDGVYWLDNKSFLFNFCRGTIAPLTSGISPCDTFRICEGDSVLVPFYFFATTQGDSVWSNLAPPYTPGVSVVSDRPGPTDSLSIKMVGSPLNVGYNKINAYGYDNESPSDTTYVSFIIEVMPPPSVHLTAVKDTICPGDTAILSASGGDLYSWSTGDTTSSIKVHPSSSAVYSVEVTGTQCSKDTTIQVYVNTATTAKANIVDSVVCPNGTSYISISTSGGAYRYKWSNGATTSSVTVNDTTTATYTATVYGICDSVKLTKTVTVVPFRKPVINGTAQECYGSRDVLTVSGGVESYIWSNGKTGTTYNTGAIYADSTVTVVGYDSVGQLRCADTVQYVIKEQNLPIVSISPPVLACEGSQVVVKATASGTGPFTYLWSPGGGTADSIIVLDSAQTYTVKVSNGCITSKSTTVAPDIPDLSVCCSKIIFIGDDTVISASGSGINHYQWDASMGSLSCDTCVSITVSPTVTTTYTLTGTDSLGCQVERIVTIVVETPCADFTVPNVFTPDNAGPYGKDDVVYIKTINMNGWSMLIYDRWGKEVFKSNNPKEYWDGKMEGGSDAPDGVYYYIIQATCQGNTYKKDGFVQLIR